jgi:hypothetical protein
MEKNTHPNSNRWPSAFPEIPEPRAAAAAAAQRVQSSTACLPPPLLLALSQQLRLSRAPRNISQAQRSTSVCCNKHLLLLLLWHASR